MSEGRPTFGIAVITHQEERNLPPFLAHLLPWVDQIVIVDDGSTDRTESIAMGAGDKVRFIRSPRTESEGFQSQRNKCIDLADTDWLMHLDADERVTPELAREIRARIGNEDVEGYRYRRRDFFLNRPMRGGAFNRWNKVQVHRRDVGRFVKPLHENLVLGPDARVGQLEHEVWHLTDASYAERVAKSVRYSQMRSDATKKELKWHDLVVPPLYRATLQYFVRRGYKDGVPGLLFAIHCFDATFRANALAWDEQHRVSRAELEEQFAAAWEELTPERDEP